MSFGRPSRYRFEGSVVRLKSVFTAFDDPVSNRIRHRYRLHPTVLGRKDGGNIDLFLSFDYFDHKLFPFWRSKSMEPTRLCSFPNMLWIPNQPNASRGARPCGSTQKGMFGEAYGGQVPRVCGIIFDDSRV